jgi:hypothetical protein
MNEHGTTEVFEQEHSLQASKRSAEMLAQVTLTPPESKKLISKAFVQLDVVKKALDTGGYVVLHPSSSTFFIVEEITGTRPNTPVWVAGVIAPKGACNELALSNMSASQPSVTTTQPEDFKKSWVISKGKLTTGISLSTLFDEMGPGDVYGKGVNALDPQGTVGILIGNRYEGGTIGKVISASRRKGFTLIFPVGLEKLIPGPIEEASKEALKARYEYSMGISCGLLACKEGLVLTEREAVRVLSGATAIPIAAGGLGGAEGATTMVIKGERQQVNKAIEYIEQCKGARLPRVRTPRCEDCHAANCDFPVTGKPWVHVNDHQEA